MSRAVVALFAVFLALPGCATGPQLTLEQVPTHSVIPSEKSSVMDAVRMFAIKEDFRITSFEEETGRIIGFRNVILSRQNETRRIIMHLTIVAAPGNQCELTARFVFGDSPVSRTKEEENILVGCYTSLFDHLGVRP